MSMTSPQQEARCEICGRGFADQEEAAEHVTQGHGGPSGHGPGGTKARDSDSAGGTVEQTEGGAGRVQTE
jgi:hypothetical protein